MAFAGQLSAQEDTLLDSLRSLLETTQGEDRLRVLFDLSQNSALPVGERIEYAEDAVDLAGQLKNTELLVEAYIKQGDIFYEEDQYDRAVRSFEQAYQESEKADYRDGMANALIMLGAARMYDYNNEAARENLTRAEEIASGSKNPQLQGKALYYLGELSRRTANYPEALAHYTEARRVAEEADDLSLLPDIIGSMGLIMYLQGDFQQAIRYYEEAAELFNRAGATFNEALMYLRIGNARLERAEYDLALNFLQKALPLFEEINSTAGIAAVTNSIGVIYFTQELYDKALELQLNHLERMREVGDQNEIANSLGNIGNVYSKLAEDSLRSLFGEDFQDSVIIESSDKYLDLYSEALRYHNEALKVWEELGNTTKIIGCYLNIGTAYVLSGKPTLALEPLEKAQELNLELNNKAKQATIHVLLGQVYLAYENYTMAEDYLNSALDLAIETGRSEIQMNIYRKLSELYEKRKNHVRALEYYKLYFATNDSLNQEKRRKAIADMQVKYETEATEKENALLLAQSQLSETKLKQQRIILIITIIAIGVFIVMMVQLIRQNNLKKKANLELEQKNELITEQKKEITDSIQYASRIQNAMLPPGDYMDKLMPERFIIFMPRDIVSGDYYYITEKDGKIICVAADCTGHGVPGAFMSMLGIAYLNEIISKHASLHANEVLDELRNHVINSLHQTGKEGESQDGMDVALYILDPKTKKLEFSGANNSLLVMRNGEMIEFKADKMPIGIHTRFRESFTRHNLDLQKGDMVYTFSDGYPDQFGGPNHKKFMIKNFKKLLQEIHTKPADEQKKILEKTLKEWMADTAQVDDILIIGVRI